MGMVVDSVWMSLRSPPSKSALGLGTRFDTNYLLGLYALQARMLTLVDIDKLMSGSEIGLIEKLAA